MADKSVLERPDVQKALAVLTEALSMQLGDQIIMGYGAVTSRGEEFYTITVDRMTKKEIYAKADDARNELRGKQFNVDMETGEARTEDITYDDDKKDEWGLKL